MSQSHGSRGSGQRGRGRGRGGRGRGSGGRGHSHSQPNLATVKRSSEEFESEGFLGLRLIGPTSYDLLAQTCGCSADDLKKYAKIKRLKPSCSVHEDISNYVKNGCDGRNMSVKMIYKISRHEERDVFNKHFRMMLWHGTSPSAICGIIKTGFRKGSGGLFGGGIYFADRIAKSDGYASHTASGTKLFILAEIAPGKAYKAHHFHADYSTAPKGFDSVKGMGSRIPNWSKNSYYNGAILPCGETIQNPRFEQYDMNYNEYIVYDADRIIVRFVVEC